MAFIVALLIFVVFGLIVVGVLYFILQFLVVGSMIFGLTLSSLRMYLNNASLYCGYIDCIIPGGAVWILLRRMVLMAKKVLFHEWRMKNDN